MSKPKKGEYAVGYGKPPEHTKFVKGQSGNPAGRPKGAKSVATRIQDVLNQKVRVNTEKGPVYMTKLQAALMQLANLALSGKNRQAIRDLLQLAQISERALEEKTPLFTQDHRDASVITDLMKSWQESQAEFQEKSVDPASAECNVDEEQL